jgi:hypothetical protein
MLGLEFLSDRQVGVATEKRRDSGLPSHSLVSLAVLMCDERINLLQDLEELWIRQGSEQSRVFKLFI